MNTRASNRMSSMPLRLALISSHPSAHTSTTAYGRPELCIRSSDSNAPVFESTTAPTPRVAGASVCASCFTKHVSKLQPNALACFSYEQRVPELFSGESGHWCAHWCTLRMNNEQSTRLVNERTQNARGSGGLRRRACWCRAARCSGAGGRPNCSRCA